MNNANDQFLLSMAIILLGYLCKRLNLIQKQDGECISRLIFNVTLPALIIHTFNTIVIDFSLILITIIGIVYGIFMTVLGIVIFKKEERNNRAMLSMLVPSFNIGLFAYPLVEALWGKEGIKYFGMFDVGNSLVIFGVSYIVASYFSADRSELTVFSVFGKLFKSIPLVAYTVAFTLSILGIHFPQVIYDVTGILGRGNMPLSLLLLGVYLNFALKWKDLKNIMKILSLRYTIGFGVGMLFFFLTSFDKMFKYTILIGLLLPIPTAIIQYAIEFNYDQRFVGVIANLTILLSFLIIWLILPAMPSI